MSSRSRWLILSLALVGFAFASSSAWVHYKLLTDAAYTSPCDINQSFNCSKVYLSPYGSIAGVPVALAGMLFFGLVALVAMFSKPAADAAPADRPGGAYLFALSTIGLAVIVYLGYTSWVVLKTACPLCLGTYVAVVGLFIVSGASSSMSVMALPGRVFRDLAQAFRDPMVLVLLLLLFGGVSYAATTFPKEGALAATQAAAPTAQASDDFATAWAKQPRVDLGIPADGAKVVIVKFNDYQCPACGQTAAWYKPVLEKFAQSNPGAVKFIVKDWPWNSKCNFTMAPHAPPDHAGACEGAAAVRMARDRGPAKESEMVEWLYANQVTMTAETVKAAAERILGVTDFAREYIQKLPDIRKDVADGAALQIMSTPTLFINGVRIDRQLMPAQYLEMAIELELNKAAGK